jgi:6-phosphogluconolactonase/glucosamine-6-phosphate isomerase/deaminase
MSTEPAVEVVPSALLAGRAAVWVADRLWSAVSQRDQAHLAVSGGSTPQAMFAALAGLALPWPKIHVWQVDERVAPDGHADRNANQLLALRAVGATIHVFDVNNPSTEAAINAYRVALPHRFDVIHLGLGDDGHTASWPPGDAVVNATEPVAVVGPFNGRMRFTLTPPVVNGAYCRMFLIAGAGKAVMLEGLLSGDPALPASSVSARGTTILTDVIR